MRPEILEAVRRKLSLVAMLLALSAILAACEYPGVIHPLAIQAADSTPTAVQPEPTESTPTPEQSPAQETPTPEPLGSGVEISLRDFRLDPDQVAAKAGTITFVLKNEGRYTHDFRVEGQGVDDRAPKVGQGRTFEWQATLPPGTYRISCPISNHADRGMNGTLEVT